MLLCRDVFLLLSTALISIPQETRISTTAKELLQLSLHVIHLISRLEKNKQEDFQFRKTVHHLILQDPRGQEGESLLHLSVDPKISLTSEEPFLSQSVQQAFQTLLEHLLLLP
jgi:hypothetical protein